ncbi:MULTISPECIES: efflux RND transporter periplasmic adaptor subunit [unclassified Schlesneria]|uniref:efflux RND transporter periplasmic adaptor subunit n=1 Tax=Schlesneria TaxID=656899 RepID=UPI002EF9A12D
MNVKQHTLPCLGLLMLLTASSPADEAPSKGPGVRRVRLEKCHITLIDQVTLASDRTGILKLVEFKEGHSVTAGSLVALIADEVAQANLAVAEKKAANGVELEFSKIAKSAADSELNRLLKANQLAVEKGGKEPVPQLEIDKARLAADKAALSIQLAEHELGLNKLNAAVSAAELKTYSVQAQFDGVVTRIYRKKGEAVRQGDPVAEIVNTDRVRVEGNVPFQDLSYARQGAKVYVKLHNIDPDHSHANEVFEGKITFVDVVSEPIDRTTRVYAEVRNRDNILRAGLEAVMEIEVEGQVAAKVR